jgi:hypothetical protein
MYTRTSVILIPAPMTAQSATLLQNALVDHPHGVVIAQLPGRSESPTLRALKAKFGSGQPPTAQFPALDTRPPWAAQAVLQSAHVYALPNGRRYALFEPPTRRDKPVRTARSVGSMKSPAPWRSASAAATWRDPQTNRVPHPRPNARQARRSR